MFVISKADGIQWTTELPILNESKLLSNQFYLD